jgi:hypothetical protein
MKDSLLDIYSELQEAISCSRQLNLRLQKVDDSHSLLMKPFVLIPLWHKRVERAKRGAPDPVDLGLSVLWASRNFGAPSEEQPGFWIGWGDVTAEKCSTLYDDYPCADPPQSISGSKYDIARQKWAETWRIPSRQEMEELITQCQWVWTEKNGIPGFMVIGKNENSIFLPAGGQRFGTQIMDPYDTGRYWCGNIDSSDNKRAFLLDFNMKGVFIVSRSRSIGMLIRPVLTKEDT